MGAPVVRRDELESELKKQNAKINRVKREVRAEITEYLEERFARLEAALDLELEVDEDSAGALPPAVEGDSEEHESPGQTPDILSGLDKAEEGAE